MSIVDRTAILICLSVFLATAYVSDRINERLPHIEDEMAFVWQARAIARGKLAVSSPQPNPDSFLVPFVIDYQGKRFGKYPIGWPVVLAAGERLQTRHLINPILTAASIWLVYRLGKKLFNPQTAITAAFLGAVSPFVLMNGSSLLSHPWSWWLTLIFIIGWLDAFTSPNPDLPATWARIIPTITAALALGLLALTRPWTAVGIAIPFGVHALILFIKGNKATRSRMITFGMVTGIVSSLYFVWQYAVTGSLTANPYLLWWPYDRIGFGPGIGLNPGGHNLHQALIHTLFSLRAGSSDLFGWPMISWLFIPAGLYASRHNPRMWLITGAAFSLIIAYALYWTPSWVYGPRYYYEGLAGPLLLSAAGIYWLAHKRDQPCSPYGKLRFTLAAFTACLLISGNLFFYLPMRLRGMQGLYGISQSCIETFKDSAKRAPTPALVFVHPASEFFEYACLIDLNSPFLDTEYLLAISRTPEIDAAVAKAFPSRIVYDFYPKSGRMVRQLHELPIPNLLDID